MPATDCPCEALVEDCGIGEPLHLLEPLNMKAVLKGRSRSSLLSFDKGEPGDVFPWEYLAR